MKKKEKRENEKTKQEKKNYKIAENETEQMNKTVENEKMLGHDVRVIEWKKIHVCGQKLSDDDKCGTSKNVKSSGPSPMVK